MMALAIMLAAQAADLPPCKDGGSTCKPWERDWPSSADRTGGPFNLILRWGNGTAIAIRYENGDRCEMAVHELRLVGRVVNEKGTVSVPNADNEISAFCVPG